MKKESTQITCLQQRTKADTGTTANCDLLLTYLSLPINDRKKRFATTAYAADITGLSRRTIQLWIEIGAIDAVHIGKRYEVDINSLIEYLRRRSE